MHLMGARDYSNDTADADNAEQTSNCWDQTSSTAHRFANRIESDKHGHGCEDADEPASRPGAENSNDSAESNGPPEGPVKKRL